jgi:hypothetical protein
MRNFALIAASLLFISCSDDSGNNNDNNGGMVCKMPIKFDKSINGKQVFQICTEGSVPIIIEATSSIAEAKAACEEELGGQLYYDGCPSGSVLQCNSEGNTLYYYDNELKNLNCNDFIIE